MSYAGQASASAASASSRSRSRDGDSVYVQDSMFVSEAVKRIQQCTAEIRKEANLLAPSTSAAARKKVEATLHTGNQAVQDAKRRLEKLSYNGGDTFGEQRNRSLMQQKLSENLTKGIRDLQVSFQVFEQAEKRLAEMPTTTPQRPTEDLEMGSLPAGQGRLQATADLVSEAELDVHTAIVEEYAQDISTLAQDVRGLQQAMADLSFHTKVQGDLLDSIEGDFLSSTQNTANASEQLTQASHSQRRGSKFIYWLLLLAAVLAVILIFVVVYSQSEHSAFAWNASAACGWLRDMATPRGMRSKSIGHYILGKTIGEGTFGKVKLGTHILTGEKVAVKILEKERIVDVADVERVAREIHILKLVQHPHIIQLYEIIETPRQLYLIMEFCPGGELFDHIVEQGRVKEPEASRFFHQIMAGVEQIHRMNVVHRDLKPENLLLDEQKNIKIVDFGLSNTYQDGQLLKTACGSPCYAAPEMVAGQRYVPSRCDVWSCGVILFALVCGYLPFEDQNTSALYRKILNADYQAPKFISDGVRDLISRMLNTDPETRYTITKIRTHPWYRQIPEASLSAGLAGGKILQDDVLDQLDRFGFPRDYAAKCLEMGKHNHVTTTYHLLLEKKKRSGGFLKALDHTTHAGFEGPLPADEIEVPAERTPSPYQGKSGPEAAAVAMQDADRAAGGTGALHGKASATPEPGVPNYGNWAFPGQLPGNFRTGQTKRATAREASEASTRAEHSYSGSGHVAPLSELTPRGAPTARQPSRGSERRPDNGSRAAPGSETERGRKAQTPRGVAPASGTPTPGSYRSGTPNRRPFAGLEPYSARDSSRPGTSQGINGPTRPSGPATSRAQYINEARRRHYAATPEAGMNLAPVSTTPTTSSRGLRPAEGAAATAASVAADLFGGQAWTAVGTRSTTPEMTQQDRSGRTPPKDRDESMRTCRGAFNVACTTSKAPKQIMQEIQKALTLQRVAFKQANAFLVRCQKQSLRFEMEISHLDHLESIYVVRFRRAAGELTTYKELCSKVLAEMKI